MVLGVNTESTSFRLLGIYNEKVLDFRPTVIRDGIIIESMFSFREEKRLNIH